MRNGWQYRIYTLLVVATVVALCAARLLAQQGQYPPPQQYPTAQQYPDQQGSPQPYPQQDPNQQYPPQQYPQPQGSVDETYGQQNPYPAQNEHDGSATNHPVPANLTLPAGAVINVRTQDWLSSDHNQQGDLFTTTLDQPLIVDGWVVAQRGQAVTGRVSNAKKAGLVKGTSQLGLELTQVTLVNGQTVPIQTQLIHTSAGTSNGRDAAAVAGTTGLGAAIGAAAGGGEGAGIGAAAGAVAGIIGVLVTPGRPTVIPPESRLTFSVQAPVSFSTERGQHAFRAATSQDYSADANISVRTRPYPGAPPAPYYAPYPYPYPYAYPYPYPYAYPYPYYYPYRVGYAYPYFYGGVIIAGGGYHGHH